MTPVVMFVCEPHLIRLWSERPFLVEPLTLVVRELRSKSSRALYRKTLAIGSSNDCATRALLSSASIQTSTRIPHSMI
jgi:hypothetical protein